MANTLPKAPDQQPPALPIAQIRDYRLVEEIGSGGMAVVYRGVQQSLGRAVAIKALKTSLSADQNVVARFEREALSVASLQHENLITLYDFFQERGAFFMVMEYVEGIDLYDLLERCPQPPPEIGAIVALHIARALDYAHFRGIIHRDVKPANVIISKLGEVKLTDFGIARIQQSDLTQTGIGLGTPAYMSPEQIVGDPLDHRSDIWSLGVVCYQMLAGRKPFLDDEKRSALQRVRLEEPPRLRKLNPRCPEELEDVLHRCMQKSPEERYGSAQELVIALEQYLARHVTTNYRARLVRFLREQQVITDDETSAMLHPALIGSEASHIIQLPPEQRSRRSSALLWAFAATMLCGGLVAGWFAAERFSPQQRPAAPPSTKQSSAERPPTAKPGYLRVLVHPWARVKIDDEREVTTPIDEAIALSPGDHTIALTNPYFEPETHTVTIAEGQPTSLTVALKRSRSAADTSAPTPDGASR